MDNVNGAQSAAFWPRFIKDRDFLTALAFFVLAIGIMLGTGELKKGPQALPRLMAWSIAALGLVLSVQTLVRVRKGGAAPRGTLPENERGQNLLVRNLPLIGLFVTYFLIPLTGFYTAIGLYLFLLNYHLSKSSETRGVLKGALFTVMVLAVLFIFFRLLLFVRTPTGFLV